MSRDVPNPQAEVIGRALASTVVTMAEMGSIGEEVLAEHGVTTIEDLQWYPAQLRREIHEAVWRRFGDTPLLSFGFSIGDYYPQSMSDLLAQIPACQQQLDAATNDEERFAALDAYVLRVTQNYDGATSVSQRAPDLRYGFWSEKIASGEYHFRVVTTLGANHHAFSEGIILSYLVRFLEQDWDYDVRFLPERTQASALHSEFHWVCRFSPKTERTATSAELIAQFRLSRKEALLRAVMLESNRTLAQVMESIRYARLLQQGQAPEPAALRERLRAFGIIWEQRDTIGGDLWWAAMDGDSLSVVLVDCAGHGVPGAMLSVLVIAALEKIYATQPGIDPSAALVALDAAVRKGLRQEDSAGDPRENDDGCDAAILRLRTGTSVCEYSGAKIGLFRLGADGSVVHHRAARSSLGYRAPLPAAPPLERITLSEGDTLVLTSDGLTDQPGGRDGVAFGYRRLTEALARSRGQDAQAIAQSLHQSLLQWQGERARRDDLTVLVLQP